MSLSNLQYTPRMDIPGLAAGQTAYTIDSGSNAGKIVRVSLSSVSEPAPSGPLTFTVLKAVGAVIDENNAVQSSAFGTVLDNIGVQTKSLSDAALDSGDINIVNEQSELIEDCVHSVTRRLANIAALAMAQLPQE
ncbi:hypothetical protein Mag101_07460 [Microbulbifer agarilyticus]|uniref:Uncharacterized protein n=1 Tax=Microbulbifer agarilyticus TaxID=260552 RepID=A0A1Q2M436_9GAMM|nr:hypothetical protein [Microbulbifer agarilyticus]AQQ67495.1 hypothetical protein Mag101_07460 [Microbulbifer agarilyticus]